MREQSKLKFDTIGYWTEVKLDIIKEYASAYSTILAAQTNPSLYHVYTDGFAGAGMHISRRTESFVPGSPVNALSIQPPFREYHLIDLDRRKASSLRKMVGNQQNVHVYEGDCNTILLERVFPQVTWGDFRRGLCLLDPYGLHLTWQVIETAGRMQSIEVFLNFPVSDMNRNVLWHDPIRVDPSDLERMNAFWGDESWRETAYTTDRDLFGLTEKETNEIVAEGFRKRLHEKAGFTYVPEPLPMRNSRGAIVYYLFFASQKPVARKIVEDIFKKYEKRGMN